MKQYCPLFLVLVLLGLGLNNPANAQQSATPNTDRPGRTFSATTLAAGWAQVETGGEFYQAYYGNYNWSTELRYGILDWLEVDLNITPEAREFQHIQGSELSREYLFRTIGEFAIRASLLEAEKQGLSGNFMLSASTQDQWVARTSWSWQQGAHSLSTSQTLRAIFYRNARSASRSNYERGLSLFYRTTLNYSYDLGQGWGVYAEIFNDGRSLNTEYFGNQDLLLYNLGAAYNPAPAWQVDFYIGKGGMNFSAYSLNQQPLFAGMGLVWRFQVN